MFELKISTGNAAYRSDFEEDYNEETNSYDIDRYNRELIRNLKEIIEKLENGYTEGSVYDINGNKSGEWKLED